MFVGNLKIRKTKNKNYFFYLLSFSIILIYRYYWSTISQWREDQATNIWLSYTKTLSETPVGLLSSKLIPNPNGMIIFGKIFTFFDSLLTVTFFLSMLQILIFYFFTRELTNNLKVNNFALIIISISTLMSSSSVEFWNNWVLIFINGLFFIFILKFLNTKRLEYLFFAFLVSTIPPALYLAGLTNSIVYFIIITFSIIISWKPLPILKKTIVYAFTSVVVLFSYFFIWKPFFRVINLKEIFGFSNITLYERFKLISDNLLHIPGSFITIWTNQKSFLIFQLDRDTTSTFTYNLFKLFVQFHKVLFLMLIVYIIIGIALVVKNKDSSLDVLLIKKLFLFVVFVSLSVLLNPILGGPNFLIFERMENMSQFYNFYILVAFLTPFIFRNFLLYKEKIIYLNKFIFLIFIFLNFLLSVNIISNSLNYEGSKLSEADVPLISKINLIDFLGQDVKLRHNKDEVSISYFLGGGIWDWIPTHSNFFAKWYKDYPYTIGRAYDYQLLKKYSIKNTYEGLNARNFGNSEYVVTYKFDQNQVLLDKNYTHFYFGQLRLSVRN